MKDSGRVDTRDDTYRAFISYSHQDEAWGSWLHKGLETYRVPKALVGKPCRDGLVPERLFTIFAIARNCRSRPI